MGTHSVDIEKVTRRSEFFIKEFERLAKTESYKDYSLNLSIENAKYTAEASMLLGYEYKERRGIQGLLKYFKIAAITSLVIGDFVPLGIDDSQREPDKKTQFMNPMFAMRIGCNIVDHPFHTGSWENRIRFYNTLMGLKLDCLDGYKDLIKNNLEIGKEHDIVISDRDMRLLEMKMNMFSVLSEMKIFKK